METINKTISKEVKEFLQLNLFNESYRWIKHEYDYNSKNEIDFSIQPSYIIEAAERDLKIISERVKVRSERKGFLTGDVIALPDGQSVIISHVWADTVQTSWGGSCHLSSGGGISFSGGLDSGIKKSDLILTDETEMRPIWIFHEGSAGGGRGVYSNVPFKVYRTKKGADLTGIPQVAALEKKKFLETCETITRKNGNDQLYTMPVPMLIILTDGKYERGQTVNVSGLDFVADYWKGIRCQPTTVKQINDLLQEHDFKGTYYNCSGHQNELHLEYATDPKEFYKKLR